MTATRSRPVHHGAWMHYYDGRDKMEAAGRAAWADAAECEVDGLPTAETAREWLDATVYAIATYGGGLAESQARPTDLDERLELLRKALVATAYRVRSFTYEPPTMALDTVGFHWCHVLFALSFEVPFARHRASEERRKAWLAKVAEATEAVCRQWRSASDLKRIASWLFPEPRP